MTKTPNIDMKKGLACHLQALNINPRAQPVGNQMPLNRDGDRRGSEKSGGNSSGASKNKTNNNTSSARFMTPVGRMAFQHLFEPEDTDTGPKYNVTLLFPPETDLRPLKNLLYDAMEEKFGDSKDWPRNARKPSDVFGDCSEKDYVGYKDGWTYVKFASKDVPGIVDAGRNIVDDKREVYNGRWARVSGTAFAYDNKSKGCAFGLNNVQILQNDDTFSGRPRAEDEFDDKYKDAVAESDRERAGRDDDDRGRGRDGGDRDRGSSERDRGGRDRDDRDDDRGRDRSRDDDDSRARGRGDDRGGGDGRGRGRDDDRDSRGRDDDDRGSNRDARGRDDRGTRSRDRDEDDRDARGGRSGGRDDDRPQRGRDDGPGRSERDRDGEGSRSSRGSDREDRDRGRGRDDDRDRDRGRDRDNDRGSSRSSGREDSDRERRSRSRDEDDRFRD